MLRLSGLLAIFLSLLTSPVTAQWEYLGIGSAVVLDMDAHGGVIMTTGGKRTHVSTDAGMTWTSVREVTYDFQAVTWAGDGFFIGKGRGDDYKTDPSGTIWEQRGYCSYEIKQLFFDTLNGSLYAANMRANAILKSTDTGGNVGENTWLPHGTALQDQTFIHARRERMLAFYNGIEGLGAASLRYSTDGGANWSFQEWEFEYFGKKYGYTTGAWVANNGDFYAASHEGPVGASWTVINRSRNNGASWDSLFTINAANPLLTASVIYTEGPRILVTAGSQVWLSTDDGATWTDMKANIVGTGAFTRMVLDHGYVFLLMPGTGQEGFGIYRRPMIDFGFSGIADVARKYETVSSPIRTVQRADGKTEIELTLEESDHVRIVAVDIIGRETAVIYEGHAQIGVNRFVLPKTHRGFNLIKADVNGVLYSFTLMR